jgi:hypothetical protein
VERFEACIESEGASPSLKSLARYYLLKTKLEGGPTFTRDDARKLAEAIVKDHPDTYTAQKTREILPRSQ